MNPLELRKIILIGYSVDADAPVLNRDGLPATLLERPMRIRFAFWVPAPRPYKRCAGHTETIGARPLELQALRDGAIEESIHEFDFPAQPSLDEMRRRLMPVWEALALDSLGFVPNGAPQDRKPKLTLQFTAVNQPTS